MFDKNIKSLLNFIAEAGLLKNVPRSGWWTIGIKNPESVAGHSFRSAVMAFIIAKSEGCDPYRAAVIALFNDIHEARITDLHKMSQTYIDLRKAEKLAFKDSISKLPVDISSELESVMNELWDESSPEGVVARDADILECMIQGREYYNEGWKLAKPFYEKSLNLLKTVTAKKIGRLLSDFSHTDWISEAVTLKR